MQKKLLLLSLLFLVSAHHSRAMLNNCKAALSRVESNNCDIHQALHTANIQVNSVDAGLGQTPLHVAAGENFPVATSALIAAGADIDMPDDFGLTPLHLAADFGHHDVAQALIKAGADKELLCGGKNPKTALEIARDRLRVGKIKQELSPEEIAEQEKIIDLLELEEEKDEERE